MTAAENAQRPGASTNMDEEGVGKEEIAVDGLVANKASSSAPSPGSTSSVDVQALTDKLFTFLSTATPGTLGGIAVGLAAVTYLVLGRLGLLLVGAFGGIAAFIQWEQRNATVSRAVKGEKGVDLLARLLEAKVKSVSLGATLDKAHAEPTGRAHAHNSLDHLPRETRDAVEELIDAIVTNYVEWWYAPLIPSENFFPRSVRRTLTSLFAAIASHLGRKRPADAFLDFLTNSSSIVIVFFSELSNVFTEVVPPGSRKSAADAVSHYLAANPESNLGNLLDRQQQAGKFRMVAEDFLEFVDRATYECDTAKVFLREILAGLVLEMALQTCSKPEWINTWIVYLLEGGEPDFNQAIDVGMQTGPNSEAAFLDMDGNVGNIAVTKGNRNSFEMEKARKRDSLSHRKKLSKADEEMESAMEEMKKLNRMIADAEVKRAKASAETRSKQEASQRLAGALERNAHELKMQRALPESRVHSVDDTQLDALEKASPKGSGSDGVSSKGEGFATAATPSYHNGTSSHDSSPRHGSVRRCTSYDPMESSQLEETTSSDAADTPKIQVLSLHNATITLLDEAGDKGRIRNRPSWDYLIQIEPASTAHPGWMIVRKYGDFEKLHEILRRLANISGATAFCEQHNDLPSWRVHTRPSLRGELERYIRDACWHQGLAESEGMKRFLEKESSNVPVTKSGFQAIGKVGKNVFDVLAAAPAEGGKAVVEGVTGVLGNMGIGQKRNGTSTPTSSSLQDVTAASRLNMANPVNGSRKPRDSLDSQRSSSVVSFQPARNAPMERRPSSTSPPGEPDADVSRTDVWDRPFTSGRSSREHSRASSMPPGRSPSIISLEVTKLPPPPEAMADDYESPVGPKHVSGLTSHGRTTTSPSMAQRGFEVPLQGKKQAAPLTEPETRVAVELVFAVINELYTLSSAWNIRRTLLAAAKSFMLRPGNPSLASMQGLLQNSVLEANTSDAGMASHLHKLRENTMPTDVERAAWPAELSIEEKEKLRIRARRLLIQSGLPAALMGVMGQSATSEALGRLFDCLQVEEVARGLMFGVLLQAVRAITH